MNKLYSKSVNRSIASTHGQKNNGYSAFIPNTRYLVYQPRLTDAIIVISELLSYEHPCNTPGSLSLFRTFNLAVAILTTINTLCTVGKIEDLIKILFY